jgi:hypothetical protein
MLQLDYLKQAILLFERVMEMAPEEPQSYLDLGLAHFINLRRKREREMEKKEKNKLPNNSEELTKSIELVATVLRKVNHIQTHCFLFFFCLLPLQNSPTLSLISLTLHSAPYTNSKELANQIRRDRVPSSHLVKLDDRIWEAS